MERHWVVINLQLNEWPKPSYEGAGPAKAALFPLHVTTRKVAVAICWYLCTFTQGNDNPKRKKFSIRLRHVKKSLPSAQPLPSTSPWVAE